ncbi:MAG TPA: pyridoxal-phosphate dependent enzyme [Acidimicrobiia bacterium]|nr:pyridoxal-phosphate dependent enzyme [Acidimicrobiia bacterium]
MYERHCETPGYAHPIDWDLCPPTFADIIAARRRVAGVIRPTPMLPAPELAGLGGPVLLKAECLQETGSFKVRGAANTLLSLGEEEGRAGVVAVSSGNHGRAVAFVARSLGIAAAVCVSERVPAVKVDAMRSLGARVVVAGPDQDDADAAARAIVAETGATFVHPFDDPRVIAGQGTLGCEIVDEVPDVASIVVPLSGGGLVAGVALAAKQMRPGVRVFGVSQDRGPAMHDSLAAGRLVEVVEEDTLADALAGGLGPENHHTLRMCRDLLDGVVLVSEAEIAAAMRHLRGHHGLRVEGGGAVGVAALAAGRISPPGPTVVVISGGNVSDATWESVTG